MRMEGHAADGAYAVSHETFVEPDAVQVGPLKVVDAYGLAGRPTAKIFNLGHILRFRR